MTRRTAPPHSRSLRRAAATLLSVFVIAGCSSVGDDSLGGITTTAPTSETSVPDTDDGSVTSSGGALPQESTTTTEGDAGAPTTTTTAGETTTTADVTTTTAGETTTTADVGDGDGSNTDAGSGSDDRTLPQTGASEAAVLGVIGLSLVLAGRLAFDGVDLIDRRRRLRVSERDEPLAPR